MSGIRGLPPHGVPSIHVGQSRCNAPRKGRSIRIPFFWLSRVFAWGGYLPPRSARRPALSQC
eukprot:5743148-Amphidinium_carterae.2